VSDIEEEQALQEEAELLARQRRGDTAATAELVHQLMPGLLRLARRLTGSPDEAEDLVQETFSRMLPALERFEGRSRVSTYAIRTLSNIWKNRRRRRFRSPLVRWFQRVEQKKSPHKDPETHLVKDREAERIRDLVQRLEPNRRLALLLREVEDMSYEEIASVTGSKAGTVRSRISRAREELRQLWKEEES
jgi:RNA polymerase sigma-70 factor (ECF subfamily)